MCKYYFVIEPVHWSTAAIVFRHAAIITRRQPRLRHYARYCWFSLPLRHMPLPLSHILLSLTYMPPLFSFCHFYHISQPRLSNFITSHFISCFQFIFRHIYHASVAWYCCRQLLMPLLLRRPAPGCCFSSFAWLHACHTTFDCRQEPFIFAMPLPFRYCYGLATTVCWLMSVMPLFSLTPLLTLLLPHARFDASFATAGCHYTMFTWATHFLLSYYAILMTYAAITITPLKPALIIATPFFFRHYRSRHAAATLRHYRSRPVTTPPLCHSHTITVTCCSLFIFILRHFSLLAITSSILFDDAAPLLPPYYSAIAIRLFRCHGFTTIYRHLHAIGHHRRRLFIHYYCHFITPFIFHINSLPLRVFMPASLLFSRHFHSHFHYFPPLLPLRHSRHYFAVAIAATPVYHYFRHYRHYFSCHFTGCHWYLSLASLPLCPRSLH